MKKIVAIITTIIMTLCMTSSVFANTDYVCGDTNNDGIVDISDAVVLRCYLVQKAPYLPWNKQIRESGEPVAWEYEVLCGDVNNDGEVTVSDAVIIEKYVAKIIEELPYTENIEIVDF